MGVHYPPAQRRGAVLVAVIVCLSVIMLVLASIASRTLLVRRQLRREHAFQQAELLCDHGMQVAEKKLAEDQLYTDEVREISSEELGGASTGRISIVVERDEEDAAQIKVTATYPLGEQFETSCVRLKQVNLIESVNSRSDDRIEPLEQQNTAIKNEETNAEEN